MAGPSAGPERGPRKVSDRLGGFNADVIRQRSRTFSTGTTTFVAPASGWYEWHLTGAGGGGTFFNTNNGSSGTRPGGGGYCLKRVFLDAGARVSVVVGAGGTPRASNGTGGTAGGNSSVTLPSGLVLEATGGAAPNADRLGGIGVNGDVNRQGGAGATGSVNYSGPVSAAGQGGPPVSGGGGGGVAGNFEEQPFSWSQVSGGGGRDGLAGFDGACAVLWQEERT